MKTPEQSIKELEAEYKKLLSEVICDQIVFNLKELLKKVKELLRLKLGR